MLRFLAILIGFSIIVSCGGGDNYKKNVEKLDEVYGCDNPLRPLSKKRYKECIAKERGNNESFFDVNEKLAFVKLVQVPSTSAQLPDTFDL